jgi:hypothetical protein
MGLRRSRASAWGGPLPGGETVVIYPIESSHTKSGVEKLTSPAVSRNFRCASVSATACPQHLGRGRFKPGHHEQWGQSPPPTPRFWPHSTPVLRGVPHQPRWAIPECSIRGCVSGPGKVIGLLGMSDPPPSLPVVIQSKELRIPVVPVLPPWATVGGV